MTTLQIHELFAGANLFICLGIGWACICRLNSKICKVHFMDRVRYSLLTGGAMASGLQPLMFGSWPSVADVIFNSAVLAGLAINAWRWNFQPRNGGAV